MVSNKVWDGKMNTLKKIGEKAANKILGKDGISLKDCNFDTTGSGEDSMDIKTGIFTILKENV